MSGSSSRQSQMVADEMFPDGPGPLDFVDVEDGVRGLIIIFFFFVIASLFSVRCGTVLLAVLRDFSLS